MKRRDFIKRLGVVTATAALAPVTFLESGDTEDIDRLLSAMREIHDSGPPPPEIIMHPDTAAKLMPIRFEVREPIVIYRPSALTKWKAECVDESS